MSWGGLYKDTSFLISGGRDIAVAAGDLDGDGSDEIAVIYERFSDGGSYEFHVRIYDVSSSFEISYKHDALMSSYVGQYSASANKVCDIATGHFSGDPGDDIVALAIASYQEAGHTIWKVVLSTFEVDPDLDLQKKDTIEHATLDGNIIPAEPTCAKSARVAAGDLDWDGTDEAVACWTTATQMNTVLTIYDIDIDLKLNAKATDNYFYTMGNLYFDVGVGNFDGLVDPDEEIMVAYEGADQGLYNRLLIEVLDVSHNLNTLTQKYEEYKVDLTNKDGKRISVAIGDIDGDSVMLGEPIHLVVQQHIQPLVIIAEPPKHIDYIKDAQGNLIELDVSRFTGRDYPFMPGFTDSQKQEITTTTKSQSDWNFGVKISEDVKMSFGIPLIDRVKVNVQAAVNYTYGHHSAEMNKDYHSVEMGKGLQATGDDYVVARVMNVHVWRYPVIGQTVEDEDGNEGQLYVQITLPSDEKTQNVHGTDVEWYQPVHENGNIFSYPWLPGQIEDLSQGQILTDLQSFTTGAGSFTYYVDWTGVTEEGKETSSSNKLSEDVSITAQAKILFFNSKTTANEHYDHTWSSLTTSDTTLTKSQGISITMPELAKGYSYEFTPLIYSTGVEQVKQDNTTITMPTGALKVDFMVDPTATSAAEWWQHLSGYGDNTDLALNLPNRWVSDDGGNTWRFNEGAYNLNTMKGLYLLDADDEEFGYFIKDGEQVTVRVRVYNYSFVNAQQVKVKFEAQESTDNQNWGERFEIGTCTIPTVFGFQNSQEKQNWAYADVTFDTSGKAGNFYRFWITVDPDDEIAELEGHDLGEKYSNNEGYFGLPLAVVSEDSLAHMSEYNLFFKTNSQAIHFSNEHPYEGETVMLSLAVGADGGNAGHVLVCFYDGNPDDGGELFDMELIPFIHDGGSYHLRVPWDTYGKLGEHQIYAVIHGQLGETDTSNNTAVATIEVLGTPGPGGLSGEAIAGIVAGGIAAAIVCAVFLLYRMRRVSVE